MLGRDAPIAAGTGQSKATVHKWKISLLRAVKSVIPKVARGLGGCGDWPAGQNDKSAPRAHPAPASGVRPP